MRVQTMQGQLGLAVLVFGAGSLCATIACDTQQPTTQEVVSETATADDPIGARDGTTLYIWASDQDHQAADFIAVVDFDRHSHNYGRVIRTVPLPGNATSVTH